MKLILLNGPPGSGKSTLARRYADDHPPALALDVDRVRALIGGWRESPGPAGLLARDLATAAARTHLAAGHDVVVPQLLARPEFAERLEALARETGASFHEIVLLPGREVALRRFAERGSSEVEAAVPLTRAELAKAYDAVAAFAKTRPRAMALRAEDAYENLLALLAQA
ncbi:AAA family ATPase [Amycolatopsis sp. WQ 127309]|uniref:AAA family ATPase n=1 Tax=Amycolatopsis sp. WQ 127309 TaxID=2932773 RepID=UPI001FF25F7A|nr:AAA family ATPase [Amycolatopsis sp. WQ 127309]UOZ09804.1 ATP-binding protein [Amycolatopsis sp. WQ 127309]